MQPRYNRRRGKAHRMWALFQSVDVTLNVAWLSLSVTALLAWRCSGRPRQHRRAVVALLFILVVLFPVISTADDMAQAGLAYDPTLWRNTGNEQISSDISSHSVLDAVIPTALYAANPLAQIVGEQPSPQPAVRCSVFFGLASASHAPPQQ